MHRANHEWERHAWQQIRAGEPGPALARYQAHDRLHIHDTRVEAAEAMVQNWDETRKTLTNGQAVMITDASNMERDQMNAMAQDRRVQAGELGAHQVELPGKPYGLRAGDEIIFTAKYPVPGEQRIKNGITGTVIDTSRREDKVTIKTNEHEPREVQIDTQEFSELSLSYAVHINKGQGITAETSGILIGGWQTDKEHAYVTVSRAREQTQIYVSREDLGEEGFDTGAMERLAEKMKRSRAQQATITKRPAQDRPAEPERTAEHQPEHQHATEWTAEQRELQRSTDASQQHEPEHQTTEPAVQQSTEIPSPSSTTHATTSEIDEMLQARRGRQFEWEHAIDVDRNGDAGEQAREVEAIEHLAEHLRNEGAGEATITQEIAKQTAGREANLERNTQAQAEHERYIDQVLQQQRQRLLDEEHRANQTTGAARDPAQPEPSDSVPDHQPEHERVERDPYIEQAIQEGRDRQQAFEQERDNDLGFGLE